MPFDVEKMFFVSKKVIEEFSKEHQDEIFYAFSMDSSMLCLNSLKYFEVSLKKYQENYPYRYFDPKIIEDLKYNTGDWEYQGLFELREEHGFDEELYSEHYHIAIEFPELNDAELEEAFSKTPYRHAMTALKDKLIESKVFDLLNKTDDFRAFLSEHNY